MENICGQLKERIKTPFELASGQKLMLAVRAGVAEYPEAADTALKLVQCAEIVMQQAEKDGLSGIRYFDTAVLDELTRELHIEKELQEALTDFSFDLNFQPQYDAKEQKLRGIEALVRWKGQDGIPISPL